MPNTISDILRGFSASGKINIIYKLITHANGLRFKNMYLYSMISNQVMFWKIIDDTQGANFFVFTSSEKVIKPNLTEKNSIIIFDDIICGP